MLGDDQGADLLRVQRANVLVLEQDADISDELVLNLASALVQTEQGLTGFGKPDSGDDALATAALNEAQMAVLHEARGGIDQVKQSIVDFVSSKWNTGYLDDSPTTLAAVQGALAMIPLPRAAGLLDACSDYISNQLLAGHRPDWQELDAFADALGGIDYYLERLVETGKTPGDEALDLTEESLAGLPNGSVDTVTEGAQEVEERETATGDELSTLLGADLEDFEIAAPNLPHVPPPVGLGKTIALDFQSTWWTRWWKRRKGFEAFAEEYGQLIRAEAQTIAQDIDQSN